MDRTLVESCYLPAAWQALEHFPVTATAVTPISVSENITFRVITADTDTDLVLRLHRPGYNSIEELDSERAWTRALRDSGIVVPDALRSHAGDNYVHIDIPGTAEQRYAGLTRWTEGTVLRDRLDAITGSNERYALFHQIGGMAARLHNHSATWQRPPGFTRRRLGAEGLLGESPYWGRFWEHHALTAAEQVLILDKRQVLRRKLEGYGRGPERFGLIHADIDPGNLILNGEDLAIIDFDDSGFGWFGYDLAPPLDELLFAPDLDALAAALLEGYQVHRPLSEEDIDMLPVFLLIRGMTLIGWYHERPEHADDDYFEEVKAWVLAQCSD